MKNLRSIFIVAALAVTLGGCALNAAGNGISLSPDISTSVKNIGAFTMTDLQNADAIAVQNKDDQGHTCYVGLEEFVTEQEATANGAGTQTVSGAFSAFEAGRVALDTATNLISTAQVKALETACGPLVVDTQNNAALFLANLAQLGVKP